CSRPTTCASNDRSSATAPDCSADLRSRHRQDSGFRVGAMTYSYPDVSRMIDHSLLNPTLTVADLEEGCRVARAYDVASACIMPYHLARCGENLSRGVVRARTTIRIAS